MSLRAREYEDELHSIKSEVNNIFDEDMEASRHACMVTGTDPVAATASESDAESDEEDDLELLRRIQKRFSLSFDMSHLQPHVHPPAVSISDDNDEDDFETLRAIQRRFASYDTNTLGNNFEDLSQTSEQVPALTKALEDIYNDLSTDTIQYSRVLESSQVFFDAIKKNRSMQKFIRSKFIQTGARIKKNGKLIERVKILKKFQATCRRRTGVALSRKKDPRAQLISAQKLQTSNNSKMDDRKVSAMYCGPAENSRVGDYRMALTKYSQSLDRKKWSDAERESLGKGIKQQFHEMILKISTDQLSYSDGSTLDDILASIKNHEITTEQIPQMFPKVNWDQLASTHVASRSGAECEARWLNCEDPLVNHSPWTPQEDKDLLLIIQEVGVGNWFDIAESLKANRTPFQCLARYQRSLNSSILKKEWSKEEDDQLRIAVETFGERDWQSVSSSLQGRTGTQCSNRWLKSLHPTRQKVGRWAPDEDKCLKVAVMLFGPKNWNKIAEFVLGRTQVQCRERWVNSLDPSLKLGHWTIEEDSKLRAAVLEHGYCWSKVAACVSPCTDNQCLRRWKVLLPDEVSLHQAAKKIQKAVLIGNFVEREAERPSLDPKDFLPLATSSLAEPKPVNSLTKCKRKSRCGAGLESDKEEAASCTLSRPRKSKMDTKMAKICLEEVQGRTNNAKYGQNECIEADTKRKRKCNALAKKGTCSEQDMDSQNAVLPTNCHGDETSEKKKRGCEQQPSRRNMSITEPCGLMSPELSSRTNDDTDVKPELSSCPQSTPLTITKGGEVKTTVRDGIAGKKSDPKRKTCRKLPNGVLSISESFWM